MCEIKDNYLYEKWIELTGDRNFVDNRPERIKKLHNNVAHLYDALPDTPEGQAVVLRELELLLYWLKYEYEQFMKR